MHGRHLQGRPYPRNFHESIPPTPYEKPSVVPTRFPGSHALRGRAVAFRHATTTQAQVPGDQDASFATGPESSGSVHALALQPNGQVLVGGGFSSFRGAARNEVARLNADGKPGYIQPRPRHHRLQRRCSGTVYALGLQANGQIIAAGPVHPCSTRRRATASYGSSADGSLDSFVQRRRGRRGRRRPRSGEAQAVAVLPQRPDSRRWPCSRTFNGVTAPCLARLNADGSLDASFNAGGSGVAVNGYGNGVESIVLLANGQILISGGFSSYNGVAEGGVARLNADGSLDATFQVGTGADYVVTTLGVQADGRILAAGGFNNFDGANISAHLVRLKHRRQLGHELHSEPAPACSTWGISTPLLVQADGTVIIGGDFLYGGSLVGSPGSGVLRLDAEGAMDDSFDGSNGVGEAADARPCNRTGKTPGGLRRKRFRRHGSGRRAARVRRFLRRQR